MGTGRAPLRKTQFTYDQVRRTTQAQFDNDGNGTYEQAVSYQYDRGSLRTQLTLPDGKLVTYSYNARGHLTGLADNWSDHRFHTLTYDDLGRLRKLDRPSSLDTDYVHDVAGRVTRIKHYNGATTLAQYDYLVNTRGDRTRAQEQWLPTAAAP